MSLYAIDDDDIIHAADAEYGKSYFCLDCFLTVKKRRGKLQTPHFYHLKTSPKCRLYSKTEDHLLTQLQIQKLFPEKVIQLEKPFTQINRVADCCWEDEKIIFEIQCSAITEVEVKGRIRDYESIGYQVVWLLDDRRYNKKIVPTVESFLRTTSSYFVHIKMSLYPEIYDQFEIINENIRVKRGVKMPLKLTRIHPESKYAFSPDIFPKQILTLNVKKYFSTDRMKKALSSPLHTMQYWKTLETQKLSPKKLESQLMKWLQNHILKPYSTFLDKLIKNLSN